MNVGCREERQLPSTGRLPRKHSRVCVLASHHALRLQPGAALRLSTHADAPTTHLKVLALGLKGRHVDGAAVAPVLQHLLDVVPTLSLPAQGRKLDGMLSENLMKMLQHLLDVVPPLSLPARTKSNLIHRAAVACAVCAVKVQTIGMQPSWPAGSWQAAKEEQQTAALPVGALHRVKDERVLHSKRTAANHVGT